MGVLVLAIGSLRAESEVMVHTIQILTKWARTDVQTLADRIGTWPLGFVRCLCGWTDDVKENIVMSRFDAHVLITSARSEG